MLLLSGPPGCGLNLHVLGQIRSALRCGAENFRVIVPSRTLAARLRRAFAREGFCINTKLFTSLEDFARQCAPDWMEVPGGGLELLAEAALNRLDRKEFRRVAALPGFRSAVARRIEEVSVCGCDGKRLARLAQSQAPEAKYAQAFAAVYHEVERDLNRRGMALPVAYLTRAQECVRDSGVRGATWLIFHGFASLTDPELELIEAARTHADITVSLPLWAGAEPARAALLMMGFAEKRLAARPIAPVTVIAAATPEQEAAEIARRIREEADAGRPLSEIGVAARDLDVYLPILEPAFERYGIPARFRVEPSLAAQPAVRYMASLAEAVLSDWDYELTLAALRNECSGLAATDAADRLDFAVRERIPGNGLAGLRDATTNPALRALLDRFSLLDSWRAFRRPAQEWAAHAKTLRALVRSPRIDDGCTQEAAALWRREAAALERFDEAMDEAAVVLEDEPDMPFSEFWRAAWHIVSKTRFTVPDLRAGAVEVGGLEQAGENEASLLFICGLVQPGFGAWDGDDPILPEAVRALLRRSGLRLETAEERLAKERVAFDLALGAAAERIVLSYPECDADGVPVGASPLLDRFADADVETARPATPAFAAGPTASPATVISAPDVLAKVRERHAVLNAAAIDDYLRCPFRFFAMHTLGLEGAPARPESRLDGAFVATLLRVAISDAQRERAGLSRTFEKLFEAACERGRIPADTRTEATRLAVTRDLRRLASEPELLPGWTVECERPVKLRLMGEIEMRGRAERVLTGPPGAAEMPPAWDTENQKTVPPPLAAVVSYRYETPAALRDTLRRYETGQSVELALYLLALESERGLRPVALLCCALDGAVGVGGWQRPAGGLEIAATGCTEEAFRDLLDRARMVAARAAREIRGGRIDATADEPAGCEICAYRDVCRSGERTAASVEGAAL